MNLKNILSIIIRLYGLFLLLQVPIATMSAISVFAVENSQFVKNPTLYKFANIAYPFLFLFISYVLIKKADSIANYLVLNTNSNIINSDKSVSEQYNLYFWITLLGIYFFVTSITDIIREIIRSPIMAGDWYTWSIVIAKGIVLLASYFFIFKSKQVEEFIKFKAQT